MKRITDEMRKQLRKAAHFYKCAMTLYGEALLNSKGFAGV